MSIKISFMIISVVLAIANIILFLKTSWFKDRYGQNYTEFLTFRPYGTKREFKRWSKIARRIETGKSEECKMAVIEADDLLKEVFQKIGYKEDFLEDILKNIDGKVLPSIEQVREAHKVRNAVMRDPGYSLNAEQAINLVRVYQKALSELEMF